MKVSAYDVEGQCVGVAYHEDDSGVVIFPPATRECVIVSYAVNDGPLTALAMPLRMPVDSELMLRIYPPASARREQKVDETTTAPWWRRVMEWLGRRTEWSK